MGRRKDQELTRETLQELGADVLASLLIDLADRDPTVRKQIGDVLQGRKTSANRKAVTRINQQIDKLRSVYDYDTWTGAGSAANDIESLVQDIIRTVIPADPRIAASQLKSIVDQTEDLINAVDDSNGEMGSALMGTVQAWGRAWARVDDRDPGEIAELVHDCVTSNDYGVLDEVIPDFADALGPAGLAVLEGRLRQDLNQIDRKKGRTGSDAEWHRNWARSALFCALCDIADIREDVESFIALHEEEGTAPIYATDIAQRLHAVGRHSEALDWFHKSERPPHFLEDLTDLHVAILDALERREEATSVLWDAFKRTLSTEHYRALEERTRMESMGALDREARKLAQESEHIHPALDFLVAVGAFEAAANLVIGRTRELNGRNYWTLRPAADALTPAHPLAAVLLYRLLAISVLETGKSKYYVHGVADLRAAAAASKRVDDWKGVEDHEATMAALKANHGRKRAFWSHWRDT